MSAKLWLSEGSGGARSEIFNKFRFTRLLKFCNFANPGKTWPVLKKRLLTIPRILINLRLYTV
ncbi:MAG TPA: hypothetical protein DIC22_04370 [Chitinophagaceae bacterium]|nr:hypothetical protein [Chitinophagaceae bacterium]